MTDAETNAAVARAQGWEWVYDPDIELHSWWTDPDDMWCKKVHGYDPDAALRRAICLAVIEISK